MDESKQITAAQQTAFEILQRKLSELNIADTYELREIMIPLILEAMEEYKNQTIMAQQTAVNYFKDELIKQGFFIPGGIYAQAEAMEKQQIIKAWDSGYNCYQIDEEAEINQTAFSGEKHYNDKYKKNNI